MIYNQANKTDTYLELSTEGGEKLIMPLNSVILVDDNSDLISVKNTATRKTVCLAKKDAFNAE